MTCILHSFGGLGHLIKALPCTQFLMLLAWKGFLWFGLINIPLAFDILGLTPSSQLTTCVVLTSKFHLCFSWIYKMGRVTPHRWLGGLNFKFKYDACEAVISMGELYFEKLWGHGCHKDSEGATSTQWAQRCKSQYGPQQWKTVLCPFYIIKIPYILHSFQITKLSRNPTTRC